MNIFANKSRTRIKQNYSQKNYGGNRKLEIQYDFGPLIESSLKTTNIEESNVISNNADPLSNDPYN